MTFATNTRQIIKKIGCDKLELVKGEGYWYFCYDDVEKGIWETRSVMVVYLNHLTVDIWVEDGLDFVKEVESK